MLYFSLADKIWLRNEAVGYEKAVLSSFYFRSIVHRGLNYWNNNRSIKTPIDIIGELRAHLVQFIRNSCNYDASSFSLT